MKQTFKLLILVPMLWAGIKLKAQTADLPTGSGTAADPYQVATLNNLYWITQNSASWNKYFFQTADIDASTSSSWDSNKGFSPIGSVSGSRFTGNYDGGNHSVTNLYMNRTGLTDVAGMFGIILGGTVRNLTLINPSFTISSTSYYGCGILAGYLSGTANNIHISGGSLSVTNTNLVGTFAGRVEGSAILITNCSTGASLSASADASSSAMSFGGFVGQMTQSSGASTISGCSSTGNVTTSNYCNRIGGFLGAVGGNSSSNNIVTKCYSTGNVSFTGSAWVGGFVGQFLATTISNCYATGNVTSGNAGGFTGGNQTNAPYVNCYAKGVVTGSNSGGWAGYTDNGFGSATDCYWDTQTTGKSNAVGSGTWSSNLPIGKTTVQMNTQATFSGWDFTSVWSISGSVNNGYPYLQQNFPVITSFSPTAVLSGATVTITGTNFTGVTAVTFGGTAATSFSYVNPTTITAVVASGTSGSVSVTTPVGTAALAGFILAVPPTVTSFTPATACTGQTVTITGTNFTGASIVTFGGISASTFTVVSPTSITAEVGTGASGSVSVTTAGGSAQKTGFTYTATPGAQAYDVTFALVQPTQMNISCTAGNGTNRAIFIKQALSGTASPANGTTYSANTTLGSGSQIASTGWYCIYNGTGSSVTVTGLTANTSYQIHVCEYNGTTGNQAYNISSASNNPKNQTTSFIEIQWTGNANTTNWNTAGNWNPATIPTTNHNVTIPSGTTYKPHVTSLVSSPAICNNISVAAGSTLTIDAGKALTVNGSISNNAGVNGIIIDSDVSGTGSLIHNTADVQGTIKRFVDGSTNINLLKYHLVSVPLTPATASTQNLFLGAYLYDFIVATNTWHGLGTSTSNNLEETKGYMIYAPEASLTFSFAGAMNAGTFSPLVTFVGEGNNLVPNPYPCAIDWNAASGWIKTNIANSVYVWPSGGSNYATYVDGVANNGGSNIIPAGQSYFVKATGAPTFSMTDAVRVHNSLAFYKSNENIADLLRVQATSNAITDESVVRFTDFATTNADSDYDAWKLYGTDGAPQLYSMTTDNEMLAINSLPTLNGYAKVPLNYESTFTGEVTLNFSQLESFPTTLALKLEDKLTNQLINLRQHPTYTFTHQSGNTNDRFVLHFGSATGIDEPQTTNGNIWISGKTVNISSQTSAGEKALIEIYNAAGQSLFAKNLVLEGLTTLDLNMQGFVIVKLTSGQTVLTAKGILIK
ncbi:MAG: beta strand repeat-containing protein [Bacteroidales bacterium]